MSEGEGDNMTPRKESHGAFTYPRARKFAIALIAFCWFHMNAQVPGPSSAGPGNGRVAAKAAGGSTARFSDSVPSMPEKEHAGTFVTFDVPGAVFGTSPFGMNNSA